MIITPELALAQPDTGLILPGDRRYNCVLADPPWKFSKRRKGSNFGAGADYPTMTPDELKALPVAKAVAQDNCILFMWAVASKIDIATDVMKAWGFRYATFGWVWIKVYQENEEEKYGPEDLIYGPGNYSGSNVEILLIGAKGSVPPDLRGATYGRQPVFAARPTDENGDVIHSRKPDKFYRCIEGMYHGHTDRLELFSRVRRDGWDATGHGTDGLPIEQFLTERGHPPRPYVPKAPRVKKTPEVVA